MSELSFLEEFRMWQLAGEKKIPLEEKPMMTTSFRRGGFILNYASMVMLDLIPGDLILLHDSGNKAIDFDHRFWVTKGFVEQGQGMGKRIGVNNNFLDSKPYFSVYAVGSLPEQPDYDGLVRAGIGEYRRDTSNTPIFRPYRKLLIDLIINTDLPMEQLFSGITNPPELFLKQNSFRLSNFRTV